jgi:hypothetical protein
MPMTSTVCAQYLHSPLLIKLSNTFNCVRPVLLNLSVSALPLKSCKYKVHGCNPRSMLSAQQFMLSYIAGDMPVL